jgi:uncharacterized protein YcfJ
MTRLFAFVACIVILTMPLSAGARAPQPSAQGSDRVTSSPRWQAVPAVLTETQPGAPASNAARPARLTTVAYVHRRHYRRSRHVVVRRRSRRKSAMIVGGSALGGAGIGALVGGGKGAAIGAVAGGAGGYIYDRKTRKKKYVARR